MTLTEFQQKKDVVINDILNVKLPDFLMMIVNEDITADVLLVEKYFETIRNGSKEDREYALMEIEARKKILLLQEKQAVEQLKLSPNSIYLKEDLEQAQLRYQQFSDAVSLETKRWINGLRESNLKLNEDLSEAQKKANDEWLKAQEALLFVSVFCSLLVVFLLH